MTRFGVLLTVFLVGCMSVRVPQLPQIDRLINPSDNPRNDERWLVSYGNFKRQYVPLDVHGKTLFLGAQGELISVSSKGELLHLTRFMQEDLFISWSSLQATGNNLYERVIYRDSKLIDSEKCLKRVINEKSLSLECYSNETGYKKEYTRTYNANNELVSVQFLHPLTGKQIQISRLK